jgi:aspartokinase
MAVTGMGGLVRVRGARDLAEKLAQERISVLRLIVEVTGATAVFSKENVPDWPRVRGRLGDVVVEEDLAAATIVGEGVGSDPARMVRALEAARGCGAEILGAEASPLRLTLWTRPDTLDQLVRALHGDLT